MAITYSEVWQLVSLRFIPYKVKLWYGFQRVMTQWPHSLRLYPCGYTPKRRGQYEEFLRNGMCDVRCCQRKAQFSCPFLYILLPKQALSLVGEWVAIMIVIALRKNNADLRHLPSEAHWGLWSHPYDCHG